MNLIHKIRCCSHLIKRAINKSDVFTKNEKLTGTHGFFLSYLYENRDKDVFQKDIEKVFDLRRSSVTEILTHMEVNNLIKRVSVQNDKRLKKIVLTELGESIYLQTYKELEKIENVVESCLTPEEQKSLGVLLDKISIKLVEKEEKNG